MSKINEIIDGLIFIKDGTKDMSERETINKACDILAKVEHGENDYKKIMAEVKKINTFDRLQEICNAERDGRCVILPCKVGDTVYWADADSDEALELPLMGYWVTVFSDGEKKIDGCVQAFGRNWSKPFGTCLFLTREEAEQALKGGATFE